MTLLHLILGIALVPLTMAAVGMHLSERLRARRTAVTGWALALLVTQAASGMLLFSEGGEAPGGLHVALALSALAVVAAQRLIFSDHRPGRDPLFAAVWVIAAAGAALALVTGLVAA